MLTAYKQLSGAVLGVLRSPDDGSEYALRRPETIIGRNCSNPLADCLLRADKLISRKHLRIRAEQDTGASRGHSTMRLGPSVRGEVEVTVIMCSSLCPANRDTFSNPKVRLCLGSAARRHDWVSTNSAHQTTSPSFDQSFRLPLPAHPEPSERMLELEVRHDDSAVGESPLLGQLSLDLDTTDGFNGDWTRPVDKVFALSDPDRRVPAPWQRQKRDSHQQSAREDVGFGCVHLRLEFLPDEPLHVGGDLSTRFFIDCIGRNHIVVNGVTLAPDSGQRELRDRDRVMVGSVSFEFEAGGGASGWGATAAPYGDSAHSPRPHDDRHSVSRRHDDRRSPDRQSVRTEKRSPSRRHDSSHARGALLNGDDRALINDIFDFIDAERRGYVDAQALRQFAALHHDPESQTTPIRAMEGVLDEMLDTHGNRGHRGGGSQLGREDFLAWFGDQRDSHRLEQVLSLFREKWMPEWDTLTEYEMQSAAARPPPEWQRPPPLADIQTIRAELAALFPRSFSEREQAQSLSTLVQTAERKMSSGIHPNKMLDWVRLFNSTRLRDAARDYPRIHDLLDLDPSTRDPTYFFETYVNAVDSVWLVNGKFQPGNPLVSKTPPSSLSLLRDRIESGEYDVNEYLIGDDNRRQELGLRQSQEDRLTPLLLLASGNYGWGQQVYDLMQVLVERRANVNELDVRGYNALFYLVEKAPWGKPTPGLERITKQLLSRTDVSHRDEMRRTVFHVCVEREGMETTALRPLLLPRADEMRLDAQEKDSLLTKIQQLDRVSTQARRTTSGGGVSPRERKGEAQEACRATIEALRRSNRSIRDIKQMFSSIDTNGDGKLSPYEFAKGLRQQTDIEYETSMELADQVMEVFDRNGDNAIDLREFLKMFRSEQITRKLRDKLQRNSADLHRVFDAMDENGDGVLSAKEFRSGLEALGVTKRMSRDETDDLMVRVPRTLDALAVL